MDDEMVKTKLWQSLYRTLRTEMGLPPKQARQFICKMEKVIREMFGT